MFLTVCVITLYVVLAACLLYVTVYALNRCFKALSEEPFDCAVPRRERLFDTGLMVVCTAIFMVVPFWVFCLASGLCLEACEALGTYEPWLVREFIVMFA